jgi:hypothetical protein
METDSKQLKLQKQLSQALKAAHFFDTEHGRLLEELLAVNVNQSLRKITSDKYVKDHLGYVAENAWLRANQRLLKSIQILADENYKGKLEEALEEYDNGF